MKRLLEELEPGFETSLLSANSHAKPAPEARERALLAVTAALAGTAGIAGVAGMAAHTTTASTGIVGTGTGAAAKLATVLAWKSVAIGAILGGVVVGVGVEGAHSFDHASVLVHGTEPLPHSVPSAQARTSPTGSPSALPREIVDPSPANEPSLSSSTALPIIEKPATRALVNPGSVSKTEPTALTDVTPPSVAPEITTQQPGTGTPGIDLAAEVRAIDRARVALASLDFAGCLNAVRDYETAHPHGSLSLEAEVLRIEALSGRGDRTEAVERAHRFLLSHPDGPYRTRLRKVLGDGVTP